MRKEIGELRFINGYICVYERNRKYKFGMKFIGECGINRCEVFGKMVIFVEEFGDEFEIGIVSDNVEVIKNEDGILLVLECSFLICLIIVLVCVMRLLSLC